MGKFKSLIKKIIKRLKGSSAPAGAPPARPAINQSEIENEIDRIVMNNISYMGNLINFNSRTVYWQAVFKALAKAESNFDLTCRYVEPPSLGKDAVTGKQNTSEGLLQLSYQDSKYHSCDFDWSVDKNKSIHDASKTIFNLEKNIKCGMTIMNKLMGKKGHYIFNSGNYWAVLRPGNARHSAFINAFNAYLGKA